MPSYLRPGVFTEETLLPLNDPALEASDSVAAFVGAAGKGGPLEPTLLSSWAQFQAQYGDIRQSPTDLAFGVFNFFNNGGAQCYVVRAVNDDATFAKLTLKDGTAVTPVVRTTVTAKSPGTWASSLTSVTGLFVSVEPVAKGDTLGGRFNLTVTVGSGGTLAARENFVDVSLNPADPRYVYPIVNSPSVGSKFITLTETTVWADANGDGNEDLVAVTDQQVGQGGNGTAGSDGTGSPDLADATLRLNDIERPLTVNLPGISDTSVLTDVVNWAVARGDVFVIVDAAAPAANDTATDVAGDLATLATGLPKVSHVAVYGPRVYIQDPASRVPGAIRLVPPGGGVSGQFVRNDVERGVQKAPAGVGTGLKGVVAPYCKFSDDQLDTLNQTNINVIRSVPGAGFCIMGARTLQDRTPDRYVNIRRSLIFLKAGLTEITRFAIFEPNDEILWENIEAVITQYLTTQFQQGVLRGASTEDSFFVKCDEEINTPDAVNAGIVRIEVGVALASPAEFIVIRIGQFDGGTVVDEVEEI